MKGFKGTTGKWSIREDKKHPALHNIWSDSPSVLTSGTLIATTQHAPSSKANAQLISKAPELLDFVNRISGEMLRNDFVLSEKWYEQAKQLIKQATEVKP